MKEKCFIVETGAIRLGRPAFPGAGLPVKSKHFSIESPFCGRRLSLLCVRSNLSNCLYITAKLSI